MKKAYDRNRAKQLVPLLEAITREIVERQISARRLEQVISAFSEEAGQTVEVLELKAELATHRREIRLSMKEFERIGCVIDETQPTIVLIPGVDGNLDHGFRWEIGDPTIHRVHSKTVA